VVLWTPSDDADGLLRDALAPLSATPWGPEFPPGFRASDKVQAGYKWVSGITVSLSRRLWRVSLPDGPYLHLMFRQTAAQVCLGAMGAIAD